MAFDHSEPVHLERDYAYRARHRAAIVWLTGLSGSGKTSIADALCNLLRRSGCCVCVLDGDDLRKGLNRDLGFRAVDREESVRRAAEVAALLAGTGLIVIVALISPYRSGLARARRIAGSIPFLEVFVSCPLSSCELRDPKGLYARSRTGDLENLTGVSDPYEVPMWPDLIVQTENVSISDSVSLPFSKIVEIVSP